MRRSLCLGFMAILMCMVTLRARANSVEITFVGASGGVFLYDASLTPNNNIVSPDDVVYFYDFAGFTGGSFAPSLNLTNVGTGTYVFQGYTENDPLAPGINNKRSDIAPGDDATIAEVRFNYTGATFANPLGGTSVYLGRFTLTSAYTNTAASWTQSTDTQINPVETNINIRPTTVAAVPVPAAVWGGVSLLGLLGGGRLWKRRRELA